jgi:UDP-N-acetylmuramoylalanine--D-glutamate ligase
VLAAAAAAGIPVIGEVELAWRIRGTNDAKWLAITGTNGKTTTTTMLESMLLAAGLKAKACGNIGTPLLEAVLEPGLEVLAIELSSFQLHWQESMSADAAAVLNIAPDHLDWHGSAEAYAPTRRRSSTMRSSRACTTAPTRRPCTWSKRPTSSKAPRPSASPPVCRAR